MFAKILRSVFLVEHDKSSKKITRIAKSSLTKSSLIFFSRPVASFGNHLVVPVIFENHLVIFLATKENFAFDHASLGDIIDETSKKESAYFYGRVLKCHHTIRQRLVQRDSSRFFLFTNSMSFERKTLERQTFERKLKLKKYLALNCIRT